MRIRFRRYSALLMAASLWVPAALPFELSAHDSITNDSLGGITATVGGVKKSFSARAKLEVSQANQDVDFYTPALLFPSYHYTNEAFADSNQHILNLRMQIESYLKQSAPDGASAREALGEALHTIQDFYAHSNWVETGHASINTSLGTGSATNPSATATPCPTSPNTLGPGGGGSLTSGYFTGTMSYSPFIGCGTIRTGTCYHGTYKPTCVGINKDLDATLAASKGVTGSSFFGAARGLAKTATDAFVEGIITDFAGNDAALGALLDVRGDIGFVVDTTGSMGDEIALVISSIDQIVAANNSDPTLRPDSWVLATFNDPTWGPSLSTMDVNAFLSAVSGLTAEGGGDCPELAWHGILLGIDAAEPNSHLFFFSDADAKDQDLADSGISAAQAKNIDITFFNTGTCSPIDPTFMRAAAQTGGRFYFLQRPEDAITANLVIPLLKGTTARLLTQQGAIVSSTPVTVPVPVDSTITQLMVSVGVDATPSVQLIRPSGVPVAATDPDVNITTFSVGAFITVANPAVGTWQTQLTGSGNYSVVVDATTTLELRNFAFVQANPDIHGGFFPVSGQPLAGTSAIGQAIMLGSYSSAHFGFYNLDGTLISNVPLVQNYANAVPTYFVGAVTLPSGGFKVAVTGTDANGKPYRREYLSEFQAQPVSVALAGASVSGIGTASIAAGTTATYSFTVKNVGTAATFSVTGADSQGFITSVSPASISLAQGASQPVTVNVSVPTTAAGGTVDTITLSVANASDPTVFNSGQLKLTVTAKPLNPTASAGASQTVQCAAPKGTPVTLNGTGSSDPSGGTLAFKWSGPFGSATGATPTVLLPLGKDTITLTVTDALGLSGSASVVDSVIDTIPPAATASLTRIEDRDHHDDDDNDQDENGHHQGDEYWRYRRGRFLVQFKCKDTCSSTTSAVAQINGVSVTDNEVVKLKIDKKNGSRRLRDGILEIKGPRFELAVTCTDPSGNTSHATATPMW